MPLLLMRLERLTDAARAALERAFAHAAELRHAAVEPTHLLYALASEEDGSTGRSAPRDRGPAT